MNTKKRIIKIASLLLAVLFITSLLAACGGMKFTSTQKINGKYGEINIVSYGNNAGRADVKNVMLNDELQDMCRVCTGRGSFTIVNNTFRFKIDGGSYIATGTISDNLKKIKACGYTYIRK